MTQAPLVLSADSSQSYGPWSGLVPSTYINSPPQSPGLVYSEQSPDYAIARSGAPITGDPTFKTSTSELDRYRLLFLIVGIAIGAMFLGKR